MSGFGTKIEVSLPGNAFVFVLLPSVPEPAPAAQLGAPPGRRSPRAAPVAAAALARVRRQRRRRRRIAVRRVWRETAVAARVSAMNHFRIIPEATFTLLSKPLPPNFLIG